MQLIMIASMKRIPAWILPGLALAFCQTALANGTLTHLSGQVSVQKADSSTLAGSPGLQVVPGDTLVTGANGFARMETTDGGEMILRPDSQMKIEKYNFDVNKPQDDSFVFKVLKGGFRTVTGLISKRGNKDAYQGKTETATIGIRGTQFDLRVCLASCGALPDGTYVAVRFGAVAAGNNQGSMDFKAGQVAHVPPNAPPVLLPRDPGIGFTPPPTIPKLKDVKKQQAEAQEQAKPAADKPTADKPAADKPATDKPSADKPAADKPAADKPAEDKPATDKPAADKPAADKPAADKPSATDKPAAPAAESAPVASASAPATVPDAPPTSPASAPIAAPTPNTSSGTNCSIQ